MKIPGIYWKTKKYFEKKSSIEIIYYIDDKWLVVNSIKTKKHVNNTTIYNLNC